MISLIDTHAHIDLPAFDNDRVAMLTRARTQGIHAIVAIGHNPERWRTSAELCAAFPFIARTVGLHPNDAERWSDQLMRDLSAEVASGEPIGIGETGLDFYRNSASDEAQREAFVAQIDLARLHDLPLIIHQRNAEQAVLAMLNEHGPVRGVLHCFGGDLAFARACVDCGLMLGVGGVVTYPKSDDVREAIAEIGLDNIVLETDAPYLAPQGRRGKRNEPSFVITAAEALASIFGQTIHQIAERTTENAVELFGQRLERARQAGSLANV